MIYFTLRNAMQCNPATNKEEEENKKINSTIIKFYARTR